MRISHTTILRAVGVAVAIACVLPLVSHGALEERFPLTALERALLAVPPALRIGAGVGLLLLGVAGALWLRRLRRELAYRRASEARIEAAQRLLREVTDRIPNGVVYQFMRRADGSLRCNFVSDGVEALLGLKRADVLRDYTLIFSRVWDEDRLRLQDVIQASVESMQPYEVEYRVHGADGQLQWVRSSAVPRAGEDGSIVWNGFSTQISELKRVEAETRAARALLQEVTDGIPGAVYRFRMERSGRIHMLFASSGLYALLGRDPAERQIVFETLLSQVVEEERAGAMQDIVQSARTLAPVSRDVRVRWPDGSIHWLHAAAVPHAADDGSVIWNGFAADIGERKRLEGDLARARQQVVSMAQGLPGVVYQAILRADGMVDIVFNHEQYFALLGLKWQGTRIDYPSLMQALVDEDREPMIDRLMDSATNMTPILTDFRVTGDGPEPRWVRIEAIPTRCEEPDALAMWNGYGLDITERKRLEAELAAARDAAESANRAKGEFLANMSHEIRTPMNAIIGLSHLALRAQPEPRLRDYIEKIQASAQSLLGIINDILDFSKIEAGKLGLESTTFRLDDVLANLGNIAGVKAAEKGLELLFAVPLTTPAALTGDPLRLGQILLNLTHNAIKFTERGEVVVAVRELRREGERCWLEFAVRDSGIGMTPEQVGRLFQSFTQADTSTTRRYGGTGLGLSISKRLVELMGGRIEVDSAAGQGSEFRFTLPFELPSPLQDRQDLKVEAPLAGTAVLVVDDNAVAREILQMYLESFGFAPQLVDSGAAALARVRAAAAAGAPLRAVLLDWQMPDMTGLEAARAIRALDLAPAPAIVMISAYGRDELARQLGDLAVDGILVKPVNPSMLLDTLVQALGGSLLLRPVARSRGQGLKAGSLIGVKVLVVEDNRINQQVVCELLQEVGAMVTIAENGAEAVSFARSEPFAIVLMDLQMPVMDGIAATRAIRADGGRMPIVAMTASAMPGDRERCLEAGMNDYLSKPLDIDKLAGALQRWLRLEVPEAPVAAPAAVVPAAPARFDRPVVLQLLSRLSIQLSANDSAASDTLDALHGQLDGAAPRPLRELTRLVEGFNFDAARRKLPDVARQLGLPADGSGA